MSWCVSIFICTLGYRQPFLPNSDTTRADPKSSNTKTWLPDNAVRRVWQVDQNKFHQMFYQTKWKWSIWGGLMKLRLLSCPGTVQCCYVVVVWRIFSLMLVLVGNAVNAWIHLPFTANRPWRYLMIITGFHKTELYSIKWVNFTQFHPIPPNISFLQSVSRFALRF